MLNLSDSDDESSEFSAVIDIGQKPTALSPASLKRGKPAPVNEK
jgi:hypothetical protein